LLDDARGLRFRPRRGRFLGCAIDGEGFARLVSIRCLSSSPPARRQTRAPASIYAALPLFPLFSSSTALWTACSSSIIS
jgi:hypothetical protein